MPKPEFPWSKGNVALLATLEEIGLPERMVTAMNRDGIRLVGELVQLRQSEILRKRGLGVKSLQLAKDILRGLGLSPGMMLEGWNSDRASEARGKMGRELRKVLFGLVKAEWSGHESLESELRSLLLEASDERNAEMLALFFGFNEVGPQTLECTGQRYGLTRERVRQIAARAESRIASIWRPTEHLFAARDLLNSGLARPFSASEFAAAAKESGITESAIHLDGVIRALNLVGEPCTVERFLISEKTLYGGRANRSVLKAMLRQARKDTSARGCSDVGRLIRLAGQDDDLDSVRRQISKFDEIKWLDDEKTWLMSMSVSRNRLVNATERIFSVIPSLEMEDLQASLQRPRRILVVPPEPVLAAFLEINGIAKVTGGVANALPGVPDRDLGLNDTAFVKALRELGSPVIREKLEEYCVERLGVNVRSFYVNLSYSPLVVKVAPGVFSLLGEKLDPECVERLASQVRKVRRRNSG